MPDVYIDVIPFHFDPAKLINFRILQHSVSAARGGWKSLEALELSALQPGLWEGLPCLETEGMAAEPEGTPLSLRKEPLPHLILLSSWEHLLSKPRFSSLQTVIIIIPILLP